MSFASTTIGIRDSPLRGREIERHGRYNCSTIILEMTELTTGVPDLKVLALGEEWRRDRGDRVRPGRGADRLRSHLGRGTARSGPEPRRTMAAGCADDDDGDELTGVVALHARRPGSRHGACRHLGGGRRSDGTALSAPGAPAPRRPGRGARLGGTLAARPRLVREPPAHRPGPAPGTAGGLVYGDGLVRGGGARQTRARRLPRGGTPPGCRRRGVRGGGGLDQRSASGSRGRHGGDRAPQP